MCTKAGFWGNFAFPDAVTIRTSYHLASALFLGFVSYQATEDVFSKLFFFVQAHTVHLPK